MVKKISVGIPVYNESTNIVPLLHSILVQHGEGFEICEIIVVSDGSTDDTVEKIKSIPTQKIKLVSHADRRGQAVRQNEMLSIFKGDIFLLLEGDTLPVDEHFVSRMVVPLIYDSENLIGMTFGHAVTLPARTRFESVMNFAWKFKSEMVSSLSGVHNFYLFRGQSGRSFSRSFTEKLEFVSDAPEDTYSYLRCLELRYIVKFVPDAYIYFRSVANFSDALRQNNKYLASLSSLKKYFKEEELAPRYHIPRSQFIWYFMTYLFKNPILMASYIYIYFMTRIFSTRIRFNPFLDVYKSSKNLQHITDPSVTSQGRTTQHHFNLISNNYLKNAFEGSNGLRQLYSEEQRIITSAFSETKPSSKIIDLGVGSGRNAETLLAQGFKVHGLDFAPSMIQTTRERLSDYYNDKKLTLTEHDLHKNLPFDGETFEGAICIRVIKYVAYWRKLLPEINRVLKNDSIFVVDIANSYSLQSISQFFDTYKTFIPQDFEKELESSGFKILRKEYGPVLPFILFKFSVNNYLHEIVAKIDHILRSILKDYGSRTIFYICKKV